MRNSLYALLAAAVAPVGLSAATTLLDFESEAQRTALPCVTQGVLRAGCERKDAIGGSWSYVLRADPWKAWTDEWPGIDIPLAVSVTVVKDFVCPTVGALTLGSLMGLKGLWLGFALGYVVAAAYPFVAVRIGYGKALFPWLLPPDDGKMTNEARGNGEVFTDLSVPGARRVIVREEGPARDLSSEPWTRGAISVKSLYTLGCNRVECVFKEES